MRAWSVEDVNGLAGATRAEAWRGAVEAIEVEDHEVHAAAVEVLRALGPLDELDEAFRRAPMTALAVVAALRDAGRGESVVALLGHARAAVRSEAARTLGLIGVEADALEGLLDDDSPMVRAAAIRSLGRLGTPAALAALQARCSVERDPVARTALVDELHPRGLWR